MRHQYLYLDPELIKALLAGLDLLRLFNQLVLATGGDVEEAMEWMRYLQTEGHIPENIDLEAFFASLQEQNLVGRDSEGGLQLTTGGERRVRKSAFEEIFSTLARSPPGAPARAPLPPAPPARASSAPPRRPPTTSATTSTSWTRRARSRTPSRG